MTTMHLLQATLIFLSGVVVGLSLQGIMTELLTRFWTHHVTDGE